MCEPSDEEDDAWFAEQHARLQNTHAQGWDLACCKAPRETAVAAGPRAIEGYDDYPEFMLEDAGK